MAELGDKAMIYLYDTHTLRKKKFMFSNDHIFVNAEYKVLWFKRNDEVYLFAILENEFR